MPSERLHRVGAAAGVKAAARGKERGDHLAIKLDGQQQNPRDGTRPRRVFRSISLDSLMSAHTTGPLG
jgi:hypothetical protein